jgi:mRNA interferase MazF
MALQSGVMPKRSWVKVAQIRTLSVHRLEGPVASIDSHQVDLAVEALKEIVGG